VSLHEPLDDGERIVLIVDREGWRALDELGPCAQHARADRVKRPDPHPRSRPAEEALDAIAHLAGRLVGEGYGENGTRIDAVNLDEARNAHCEDARLAGAGAGENEDGSVAVEYGLALRGIETGEELLVGDRR
jgi:hypothetical protein